MQPFDNDKYDKRFDETYSKAISQCGLEPYRIDRDPQATILIEAIERGIRDASVCFAEISTDNPNVWFELGYCLALNKDVVLVCSSDRVKFPFDIQHRQIITYKTENSSDFDKLERDIAAKIEAIIFKQQSYENITMPKDSFRKSFELSDAELIMIVAILSNQYTINERVSSYIVKQDMNKNGINDLGFNLAFRKLIQKGLISTETEYNGNGEEFAVFNFTDDGDSWILENSELFNTRL